MGLLIEMPTNHKQVLVVGGAGYIGSHMVLALLAAGYEPIVLDNLSTGYRQAVTDCEFIHGDMGNKALLRQLFSEYDIACVMHFASFIEVAESVKNPAKYYQNNVAATLNLLEVVTEFHIPNFIFSSSAAVYGEPQTIPINETHPLKPLSPYGRSKLMVEEMIQDFAQSSGMRFALLRYFNAAGADPMGRRGECHHPESHLIPLVLAVACGEREVINIYGNDHPTPDGTCIRDYVHVSDVCEAHLLAMEKLFGGTSNIICNLGTGNGHSVQRIIETARFITKQKIHAKNVERRMGDPTSLVADVKLAQKILNWYPRFVSIESLIEHAWLYKIKQYASRQKECYET